MLTHYTHTAKAVANILTHGFAWLPNSRRLASLLMSDHDFSKREPQQFGMISFTEIEPPCARVHCEEFGFFGIVVSGDWARQNNAQRVIYVEDHGPITDAWRAIFAIGYRDVKARIRFPDDGVWLMAYENKAVARAIARSALWANLLQIYEYMEPSSVAHQREWRIVNPEPLYSLSKSKDEVIRNVSPPQNWAKFTNVVSIRRTAVEALVCPADRASELRTLLPEGFTDVTFLDVN